MLKDRFSQVRTVFQGRLSPEPGYIVGYGAIIEDYHLEIPLPDRLSIISLKHKKYETDSWLVFTPRHQPQNTLFGHLTFALKHEGVELPVFNALFKKISIKEVLSLVQVEPTGQYSRKIWFLFEWLTGTTLELPDLPTEKPVPVVNEKLQYAGPSELSKRHRVKNNLPGVRDFCPMIRKTQKLEDFIFSDLQNAAKQNLGSIRSDLTMRAAAFLLLKDSKATYAIEGEKPSQSRAQRWGKIIAQAGQEPLSKDELLRLQQIVIDNTRFTKLGWRKEGDFVGEHDRENGTPIPEHISARWQDIECLIEGLLATHRKLEKASYDAVLMAATIAFGFVFIHPFIDGNGRIHRYLIHHVLGEKGFTSPNFIFPISAVMLERLDKYFEVLRAFSSPRLNLIQWLPTKDNNVEVVNETIDLYRYFDATRQAEFLYECVSETVYKTIPEEVEYLKKYDHFKAYLDDHFQMPDKTVDLLVRFLEQGKGKLSERARSKEFETLTKQEISVIEQQYLTSFYSLTMQVLICDAIQNKQRIQFEYNGKTRVVEPQAYGLGSRGTQLLRGYEVRTGGEKLFDLSKTSSLKVIDEYFTSPGPGYQKGDSAMETIFCEL